MSKNQVRRFEVPVWVSVEARDHDHAWQKVERLMVDHLPIEMSNRGDWVAGEPVEAPKEM